MNVFKFIADEEELNWFWKYGVPPLDIDEVYYISCSMRKKKLTPKQRKITPHNEMFNKQIIKHDDYRHFIQAIKKLEVNTEGYFPPECNDFIQDKTVVYWNINPSQVGPIIQQSQALLSELQGDLADSALRRSELGINAAFYNIKKLEDKIVALFQQNQRTRHWIDYDIDFDLPEDITPIVDMLNAKLSDYFGAANYMLILCGGGIHYMVRKASLNRNPNAIIPIIKNQFLILYQPIKEIIRNDNYMIPLPGTFQYGVHIVRVLNKEQFTEANLLHKE